MGYVKFFNFYNYAHIFKSLLVRRVLICTRTHIREMSLIFRAVCIKEVLYVCQMNIRLGVAAC